MTGNYGLASREWLGKVWTNLIFILRQYAKGAVQVVGYINAICENESSGSENDNWTRLLGGKYMKRRGQKAGKEACVGPIWRS